MGVCKVILLTPGRFSEANGGPVSPAAGAWDRGAGSTGGAHGGTDVQSPQRNPGRGTAGTKNQWKVVMGQAKLSP